MMSVQPVTVGVPVSLYDQLKERADRACRSVEDEMLDVLATAVPQLEQLPSDLAEAIAPLALLDDESLWRAARSHLPDDAAKRLESLHLKRQREGLTDVEAEETAALVRQYERHMLIRARAAAVLKERGYDVSELTAA